MTYIRESADAVPVAVPRTAGMRYVGEYPA